MASTSEVGHAKNVANLQKLTEQVTVYTLYNPPVENLTVTSLQTPHCVRDSLPLISFFINLENNKGCCLA